jgi:twitching motility protein PilI
MSSDLATTPSSSTPQVSPFQLLQELEQRVLRGSLATAALAASQEWEGLAFRLRNQWFLAAAGEVHEVLRLPASTRIPNAKPWLTGLANVRGTIVPVVDLALFLGLPKLLVQSPTAKLMIVHCSGDAVGFCVDATGGHRRYSVAEQEHEALEQLPQCAGYAVGAFQRDGQVAVVLSFAALMQSEAFVEASW